MKRRHIASALTLAIACMLVGCATEPAAKTTQQEELDNLETKVSLLAAENTALVAELAKEGKYVVGRGDTIRQIAKDHGIEVKDLISMNPGLLSSKLMLYQVLNVPKRPRSAYPDSIKSEGDFWKRHEAR